MGEPVTTGMMIGAALGGGTAAIKGQDPTKFSRGIRKIKDED